ncbi:MAG: shikimate dehydrogenase [Firmicutes bacterium]|nr:shikimate dehydrogenase [Bacillota bacterium]
MLRVDAHTRICGIIGDPVEHSLSPVMHNAAFHARGINYVYVAFRVPAPLLGAAVAAIRNLNLVGVNVTIPHKETVAAHLDEVSEEARLMGAVNTVVRRGDRLIGHNTDGEGFLRALRAAGFDPAHRSVLLLGAGGAARAVAVALARAGAASISVANRTPARAERLARWLAEGLGAAARAVPWPGENGAPAGRQALAGADLVVHATPLGTFPDAQAGPDLAYECLRPGQVAFDLVYNPAETAFLARARAAGARTVSGLEMLVHQGSLAFELWTDQSPPLDTMRAALREALL